MRLKSNMDLGPKYGACDLRVNKLKDDIEQHHDDEKRNNQRKHDNNNDNPEELTKLERLAQHVPCLGIMLALCSSFFLGSAGMLVKMTHSVHGIQVAVFRALIQLIVYLVVIYLRSLPIMPLEGERVAVLMRASLGSASITFSYYALKLIPLGDATTIRFSLPIWTLIISYLVLNESCSLCKIFAVIVSISGVVLIAKPDDVIHIFNMISNHFNGNNYNSSTSTSTSSSSSVINLTDIERTLRSSSPSSIVLASGDLVSSAMDLNEKEQFHGHVNVIEADDHQQLVGCLLALSSSICLSLSLISLRLCKRTPAEITIFWLSAFSIVIGSITLISLGEWRLPDNWMDVLYIFLNGLCGTMGQWFITSALKIEQSGIISLARTFDIQVAFLYSALLLHETIKSTSILGSIMVSGGVVAVVVPKWLELRRKPKESETARKSPSESNADKDIDNNEQDNHDFENDKEDENNNSNRNTNNNNNNNKNISDKLRHMNGA